MKCTAKLANFAELLKRQREQCVNGRLVTEWIQARSKQVAGIESKLGELRIQAQMLEDRLRAERRRLSAMNGVVRFFRGRSITAGLDKLADNFHRIQENESSLVREIEEIQARSPPDTQGLDTATKRTINLMILAYAQKLYLLLCQHEVADLAKEAGDKGVGALNYGAKQSCDRILERVRNSLVTLAEKQDMADEIKHRAHRIAQHAKFQSADDAVPISTSVATVYDFGSDASVRESKQDLLDGDYWNIRSVVSR
jgi:hypothetical protein